MRISQIKCEDIKILKGKSTLPPLIFYNIFERVGNKRGVVEPSKNKKMEKLGYMTILISVLSIIKNYKNNILILLSLELFFIGISIIFLDTSLYLDDINGILTTVFILCISATESAIGLSILMINKKNI